MTTALTPAVKGQLTKLSNAYRKYRVDMPGANLNVALFNDSRMIFAKIMPREQAKHAARKYVTTQTGGAR